MMAALRVSAGPTMASHLAVKSGMVFAVVCTFSIRMPGTTSPSTAAAIASR
jgi:hypothetical protein